MKDYPYCVFAKKIKISALLGLYETEHLVENNFSIDVKICSNNKYENNDYINYETIIDIVNQTFNMEENILENICSLIINNIQNIESKADYIYVEITKLNPSINNTISEGLGVEMQWKRE